MNYVTAALGILALILIAVFSVQNLASVEVSLLFWTFTASKVVVILVAFILGMLTGWSLVALIKKLFA